MIYLFLYIIIIYNYVPLTIYLSFLFITGYDISLGLIKSPAIVYWHNFYRLTDYSLNSDNDLLHEAS